jgi:D-tyrosyl-tRNA(Tyr) deacylase
MRAVVQRVKHSQVTVEEAVVGKIASGLMVLLGVEDGDEQKDVQYMIDKVTNLRIFEDNEGKMNCSIKDVGGDILAVSQFTLLGDCRKGRRPSFINAARPEAANSLYETFVEGIRSEGLKVETGVFQADMLVDIANDGPVTLLLDSKKQF